VSVTILDREMYTEAAAARLLRVAPSTLHWWLEGRPPRYRPVIRVEPTGSRNVIPEGAGRCQAGLACRFAVVQGFAGMAA